MYHTPMRYACPQRMELKSPTFDFRFPINHQLYHIKVICPSYLHVSIHAIHDSLSGQDLEFEGLSATRMHAHVLWLFLAVSGPVSARLCPCLWPTAPG